MSKKVTLSEELSRYNDINKYITKLITEQETPVQPDLGDVPPAPETAPDLGAVPPAPETAPDLGGVPPDTEMPSPEMGAPKVLPTEDDTTEEMDITDLVNMTKSIKKDLDDRKTDNGGSEKMDSLFSKLTELETKLQGMDTLISKIDNLETEIKNSKPKTPEEKLEMRSLDSFPFNENPQEFFDEKIQQMRQSGKNEYVLTKNDIDNYSKNEITKSFNSDENEGETARY